MEAKWNEGYECALEEGFHSCCSPYAFW